MICLLQAICTLIWRELNSNGLQCTDDISVSGLTCNYDCLALVVWYLRMCVWGETIHYYWYIHTNAELHTHTYRCTILNTHTIIDTNDDGIYTRETYTCTNAMKRYMYRNTACMLLVYTSYSIIYICTCTSTYMYIVVDG